MVRRATSENLEHLTKDAQITAQLPDLERRARIRSDRWIGYSRATAALAHLDELYVWPQKQRMPNSLIVGPTNNGKSMIVEKFRRAHAMKPSSHADHQTIPILSVQMPSEPSVLRFYMLLLAGLGAPIHPRARLGEIENIALRIMRKVEIRILIVDEVHNILAGKRSTQSEFLNLIRFLGNELRIPVVGVGTRDAYLAIRSDSQLENRFEPIALPLWEEGDELASLLASFAASYPLRRASNLAHPEMARYILARSGGTIGEMSTLLSNAALVAIESGEEALNRRTLSQARYESPSERRLSFERILS